MNRLHVVPEINEANGVWRVAQMLAREDGGELIDCSDCSSVRLRDGGYDEVWVHGMWLPREWRVCWRVLGARKRLVRMTHGSLSPIYLERQGKWKKRLAGPIERWLLRRSARVVVTCAAEKEWVRRYLGGEAKIDVSDLKRFFRLGGEEGLGLRSGSAEGDALHVLYVGRRHPLKGVELLERAIAEANKTAQQPNGPDKRAIDLRIVSDHFGKELELDWAWCDVLVLPTLSENFGLVVAEALERGKRVITTDGAPAWAPPEAAEPKSEAVAEPWRKRLVYLRGYRDGTDDERVRMLMHSVVGMCGHML